MIFVPSLLFTFTAIERVFFEASRIPSHGLTSSTPIPGLCEYNTPQTSRLHNIQYVRALDPFPISSCDSMLFNNLRYNSWTYLPLVSDAMSVSSPPPTRPMSRPSSRNSYRAPSPGLSSASEDLGVCPVPTVFTTRPLNRLQYPYGMK